MSKLCMGCMKEYDDGFDICPHCGYIDGIPAKQTYHITPGYILNNRYIVGKVLGFGGFVVTYIGWDYLMGWKVAIKEYLPSEFATRMPQQERITIYSGYKKDQFKEGLVKTLDEARRLAKFDSVPGIVKIYDCFEANGTSYIIMEYLEGMSLKDYLDTRGKIPVEQALPVIFQIAQAMEQVHKTGILHRDIAPDNIYVLNPEEPDRLKVKLLDFGAARYATSKHSKSLSVIIKPGYAPVEQYRSRGDQGTWTDVYALAAVLYKMVTGTTPEEAMDRSVQDELKRPSKLGVKLPKPVENALMNALNVKIQDRTQTMVDFARELGSEEVSERAITKDKKDLGKIPKWFFGLAGVGVATVALVAALIFTGVIQGQIGSERSELKKDMVRVPNVVNDEADEAEKILKDHFLNMSREQMTYSEVIPENVVCFQGVNAGNQVRKNTTLMVCISKGKEKGVIPSVKGLQKEEAEKLLSDAGFQHIIIEESQEKGVYHSVLAISEEPGENVELSKEIILTVCANQEGQEGDASVKVQIPDVAGKGRGEAQKELEDAGFAVNWVEEASDKPKGTVVGQSPAAGTEGNKGSYVTVRVSKGAEKIYMKNVLLMSEPEARSTILGLGLAVGDVSQAYSDSVPAGKVISQSIPQDAEVKKGDKVKLVVSKGREQAKAQPDADDTRRREEEASRQEEAKKQSEEMSRQAEEAARKAAEEEAARRASEEAARRASEEEAARQASEEAARQASEEAARKASEEEAARQNETEGGSPVVVGSGERTVSKNISMIDVEGMPEAEAKEAILDEGLLVGSVGRAHSDTVPAGCVISQKPAAGKKVKPETKINLVISVGP